MQHVHYDEQKFERDLRIAFDQVSANPEVHDEGSVVLDRNREVSIQIAMMVCKELNRGTELSDIMSAGVAAFLEFFDNMKRYVADEDHHEFAIIVAEDLGNGMNALLSGQGFEHGVPATMKEIKGGRA